MWWLNFSVREVFLWVISIKGNTTCGRASDREILREYLKNKGGIRKMDWINVIFTWISGHISVILTELVAIFTGLYWWNARRSFLLELDRVVLWYRLEEAREQNIEKVAEWVEKFSPFQFTPSQREDLKKDLKEVFLAKEYAGQLAFFDTLKSKSLRIRLKKYEERQRKITSEFTKRLREQEQIKKGK